MFKIISLVFAFIATQYFNVVCSQTINTNTCNEQHKKLTIYLNKVVYFSQIRVKPGNNIIKLQSECLMDSVVFETIDFSKGITFIKQNNCIDCHFICNSEKNVDLFYIFDGINWSMNHILEINDNFTKINLNSYIQVENKTKQNFEDYNICFVDSTIGNKITNHGSSYNFTFEQNFNIKPESILHILWQNLSQSDVYGDYRINLGDDNLKDFSGKIKKLSADVVISFTTPKQLVKGDLFLYINTKNGKKYLGKVVLSDYLNNEKVNIRINQNMLHQFQYLKNLPINDLDIQLEQTEFRNLSDKINEISYVLTVKNNSSSLMNIKAFLPFNKKKCKIIKQNLNHQKESANDVYWLLQIQPNSKIILRYRMQLIEK